MWPSLLVKEGVANWIIKEQATISLKKRIEKKTNKQTKKTIKEKRFLSVY